MSTLVVIKNVENKHHSLTTQEKKNNFQDLLLVGLF
jgi:hypothetical protein